MMAECDQTIRTTLVGNGLAFLDGGRAGAEAGFTWTIGHATDRGLPWPRRADGYVAAGLGAGNERQLSTMQNPDASPFDASPPVDIDGMQDHRKSAAAIIEAKLFLFDDNRHAGQEPPAGPVPVDDDVVPDTAAVDRARQALERTGLRHSDLALRAERLGENVPSGQFELPHPELPQPKPGHFDRAVRFTDSFKRNLNNGIGPGAEEPYQASTIDDWANCHALARDHMIHKAQYAPKCHTFIYEGQPNAWPLWEQEAARLKFPHCKFILDRSANGRMAAYELRSDAAQDGILTPHMALDRATSDRATSDRLASDRLASGRRIRTMPMWVVLVGAVRLDPDYASGTVECPMLAGRKGHIDCSAPDHDVRDPSFDDCPPAGANVYPLKQAGVERTALPRASRRCA